ncbi:GNAT family N-acetyltransferase [Pediococcus claussenii]|uniref:N-acetyltransferase domain-containing protein n=1 Tax=Pediococcus claussenii (strain ATCC BAA-344 / DSM 14800 / JCM 18046 / KCTC 3811 / LMG 21948 / P06) TaxID=701521 RepID=G8PE67_PEDCP|nr:GNAT family N-acetyltransferase [Pediococcus claussenii]AEV95552.1 hypothetical protein PECL_1326 [Pediococcus claussenii ATCC BAA-344]ANZ69075.1 hypothetical protein AYR57_01620 [Pediococcus claussenii]ANZ70891.1 hypothetical protein AYR58_01620 [Pediococcus claussenii]KRN20214.1 hypothetical protein IV79_GL000881 [Pediococcus claussenii]
MNIELRRTTTADFNRYFEILSNKEVPQEVGLPRFDSEIAKQIHFNAVLSNRFSYGIFESENFIGIITLSPNIPDEGIFELGYFLDKYFWNQHIMTDAIRKFIGIIKNADPLITVMIANTWVTNVASKKVLENNGFHFSEQIIETSAYDFLPHKVDQFKLNLAEW